MTAPDAYDATRPAVEPAVRTIQRRVAARYGVRVNDIRSARRGQAVVWPRHVAIHLSRELTMRSLPEIGRLFGGRDHTTVMYALRRVELRMADDPDEAAVIRSLAQAIAADLPRPSADDARDGRLDRLTRLLQRREALIADRDQLDQELGQLDFEIDQLGRHAWGVAPEAREDQVPEAREGQAAELAVPPAAVPRRRRVRQ